MKYFNLKETRSQNALALEDVERMWIPFLVFDNTEKNEATKVVSSLLFLVVFKAGTTPNSYFTVHHDPCRLNQS